MKPDGDLKALKDWAPIVVLGMIALWLVCLSISGGRFVP